jgi:hypothetical protein
VSMEAQMGVQASPAYRVQWNIPSARTANTPTLRYSLFAEWKIEASPEIYHAERLCSVLDSDLPEGAVLASCLIAADTLPISDSSPVSLRLLTECDTHSAGMQLARDLERLVAESSESSDGGVDFQSVAAARPLCASTISPSWIIDFSRMEKPAAQQSQERSVSVPTSSVDSLEQALCLLYHLTKGSLWIQGSGWCSEIPVCGNHNHTSWWGVSCDSLGRVTELQLGYNDLTSERTSLIDVNFLWSWLPQLRLLDLSYNNFLASFNLTALSYLTTLNLEGLCVFTDLDTCLATTATLELPLNCSLTYLDTSQSMLSFDFAQVAQCSYLVHADFSQSPLNCTGPAASTIVVSLTGGALTHYLLSHLWQLTPQLQYLDISNTQLPWGDVDSLGSNVPTILSPTLTFLSVASSSMYTTSAGADPLWLTGAPALMTLMIACPGATIPTDTFLYSSDQLTDVEIPRTPLVGDLSPLYGLRNLSVLILTGSGILSTLPSNVASVWPLISELHLAGCNLYVPLPDFSGLSLLSDLDVSANGLDSMPSNFLNGSSQMTYLTLEHNPLVGSMPLLNLPLLQNLHASNTRLSGSLPDGFGMHCRR